ncbi:hypothetical protein P167DRAFT_327731 [Morchella conica CCBAS932]|uniref:Uncharacterized protein n=1 Tax=Morchella conica CCBAS932 TaxID=1392247 RepID=A0A3N4KEV1_9PEZI|nr:hypothetical protein P167DRAFT_327731 [Morchella conica CCBAS932]
MFLFYKGQEGREAKTSRKKEDFFPFPRPTRRQIKQVERKKGSSDPFFLPFLLLLPLLLILLPLLLLLPLPSQKTFKSIFTLPPGSGGTGKTSRKKRRGRYPPFSNPPHQPRTHTRRDKTSRKKRGTQSLFSSDSRCPASQT